MLSTFFSTLPSHKSLLLKNGSWQHHQQLPHRPNQLSQLGSDDPFIHLKFIFVWTFTILLCPRVNRPTPAVTYNLTRKLLFFILTEKELTKRSKLNSFQFTKVSRTHYLKVKHEIAVSTKIMIQDDNSFPIKMFLTDKLFSLNQTFS